MIKTIINKLFYNPNRYIKKFNHINVHSDATLLRSCTFRFDGLKKNNNVKIGAKSMIGCSIIFESDDGTIEIGDNTFINANTKLIARNNMIIGDYVTIAWGCTIYDHNSHSLDFKERQQDMDKQNNDYKNGKNFITFKDWCKVKSKPIIIENNVWIGFDSVILRGVTIGEGAIIGARSVVREDVEPWTIVAGNPAVMIKRLNR